MRATPFLAMAIVLAASAVAAAAPAVAAGPRAPASPAARAPVRSGAPASGAAVRGGGKAAAVAHVVAPARRELTTASATSLDEAASWAPKLGTITVVNNNTNARGSIRLYDDSGIVDRDQARKFMRIAGRQHDAPDDSSDDDERLDLRLVQLVFRAAYHFNAKELKIVSGTRPGARGKHGDGEALDFSLEGTKAGVLAAYLRGMPRAGVGIYTHPKTQYVHLDVREHSYHWIDGSPPGVTWREQLLSDPKQAARDASYVPAMDFPEH